MSRLPQLEAQLVAAAAGVRPRRVPVVRWVGLGALAAAAAAAVVLVAAPRREGPHPAMPRPAPPLTVPAATIERSHRLTTEKRATDATITPAELPGVAAGFEASTPHPPGAKDTYDWAHPRSPILHVTEVESLVEYRAYCMWLRYWVAGADRPGAAAVIADIPRWPTQRETDPYETKLQRQKEQAIRDGDVPVIQHEIDLNC